jgi:hypothetical protein
MEFEVYSILKLQVLILISINNIHKCNDTQPIKAEVTQFIIKVEYVIWQKKSSM